MLFCSGNPRFCVHWHLEWCHQMHDRQSLGAYIWHTPVCFNVNEDIKSAPAFITRGKLEIHKIELFLSWNMYSLSNVPMHNYYEMVAMVVPITWCLKVVPQYLFGSLNFNMCFLFSALLTFVFITCCMNSTDIIEMYSYVSRNDYFVYIMEFYFC